MKLIITRPVEDALPLARKLEERGHEAIIAPLLRIEARGDVELHGKNYQAICVTSANGLLRPELFRALNYIPIYCVGPQSAHAAQAAGFADVRARGGNMEVLADAMHRELNASGGPLLYVSGSETSGDLQSALSVHGFEVERIIAYDAVAVPLGLTFPEVEMADGVLLYSPRSARLWADALADFGMKPPKGIMHFCLSRNVARELPLGTRLRIAEYPDEDHMLRLLDRAGEAE